MDSCHHSNAPPRIALLIMYKKKMKHEKMEEVHPDSKNLRDKQYEKGNIDVVIAKHLDHACLTFNVSRAVKELFNKTVRTQNRIHCMEA